MSLRYKGGVLSATPPTTSSSAAPGIWTLEQQLQATAGTGWPFGGPFTYIEDVFSTWLYTGNGSTQTITNGIDLSTKGGLVWSKERSSPNSHRLQDTVRGAGNVIYTNGTNAQGTDTNSITFGSTGFSIGTNANYNFLSSTYVSWTFREQAKFFDVVTYTGDGTSNRAIAHNLGSVPGCIIIKQTNTSRNWIVYHRSGGSSGGYPNIGTLDTTDAFGAGGAAFYAADPTSTNFTIGNSITVNQSGGTYVAYLFAHNAGGFGLTGSDNVISCGSYTGVGGTQQDITLGYEPQWLMIKRTDTADSWIMVDTMRGLYQTADNALCANNANAEAATASMSGAMQPTATGFHLYNANSAVNATGGTYIYIAIRRGPMKVPTSGTSVFSPIAQNNAYNTTNTTNFPVDLQIATTRNAGAQARRFVDRLRGISSNTTGAGQVLESQSTAAETSDTNETLGWDNTSYKTNFNYASVSSIFYNMRRAPGFFDEVCYTGTGTTGQVVNHNLGVTPEMVIIKRRDGIINWFVYQTGLSYGNSIYLNLTSAQSNDGGPAFALTSTTITFDRTYVSNLNTSTGTYVAYLFATCPGVSKVGSYTGTAALLTVNCGFTTGARFVLIKRTDSTGDWYMYDSARGITSGNDPYLFANTTAAEVTGTNYVDTDTTGFQVTAAAPAALNANGGTYIFLAIA